MKKLVFTALVLLMMGLGNKVFAQDCEAIVGPYLSLNNIERSDYPQPKFDWRCRFSRCAFYMTDTVPENATIIPLTEVTSLLTGNHIPDHFVVDLNSFSYWGYDFVNFHQRDYFRPLYFDTHNTTNRYLVMRPAREIYRMAENSETPKE